MFKALIYIFITISFKNVSAQKISDQQIKQNVTPLNNSVEKIKMLNPVSFTYSTDFKSWNLPAGQQYGFTIEDIKSAIPEIVKTENKLTPAGKNAFKNTSLEKADLTSLIPFLVGSIKEQQEEIERLKAEMKELKWTVSSGK